MTVKTPFIGQKVFAFPQAFGEFFIVVEPCESKVGRWMCITHDQVFENETLRDAHLDKSEHLLCWVCILHGLEARELSQ